MRQKASKRGSAAAGRAIAVAGLVALLVCSGCGDAGGDGPTDGAANAAIAETKTATTKSAKTKLAPKVAKDGKKTGAARPVPIATLIASVKRELDAMGEIWKLDYQTGRMLGKINGEFQKRGYFSRIPSGAATSGVESNIRELASRHGLIVEDIVARVPKIDENPTQVVLKPGERWVPTEKDLFATIRLEIVLQGSVQEAAKMIDEMPAELERLIVVTGDQPRAGGVTLFADCWFEVPLPMPKIDLQWPELDERLEAAGWDPKDPKVRENAEVAALGELLKTGRLRMVDVRNTLAVAADFPRWYLRNKVLDAKSLAAQSMRGSEILGTIAGG